MRADPLASALLFPSVAWFRALADAAASDEDRYRRLGVIDMTLGIWVGDEAFRLVFADYGCTEVDEWGGQAKVDCVLGATTEDWQELIEHIRAEGHADPQHTLNSLVLAGARFSLTGSDQLGIDNFYHCNATLQAFIDEAAHVSTRFESGARV